MFVTHSEVGGGSLLLVLSEFSTVHTKWHYFVMHSLGVLLCTSSYQLQQNASLK